LAFLAVFAALPEAARADDGFRCPSGRLVMVGDRMNDVIDRCGQPDATYQRMEKRKVKHRITRWMNGVAESFIEEVEVDVPLEEWTYDLGRNYFVRYVTFENGSVVGVTTGHYGSK
jgi:hypothetical protein